jgi:hypothetical protein
MRLNKLASWGLAAAAAVAMLAPLSGTCGVSNPRHYACCTLWRGWFRRSGRPFPG